METNWRITYHNTVYYFVEAKSAFRYFMTIRNRRDAKTATIEVLNPEGVWEPLN